MLESLANIKFRKLCAIAPFLTRKTMDNIVEKCIQNEAIDCNGVGAIAPFLSKTTVNKMAEYLMKHGQANKVVAIAPFMGKEMFPTKMEDIDFDTDTKSENKRMNESVELDDLDEETVAELAHKALERGECVEDYLDYMDEEAVAELANRALELGEDIECFLDYLDEDMVKQLLLKAVKK